MRGWRDGWPEPLIVFSMQVELWHEKFGMEVRRCTAACGKNTGMAKPLMKSKMHPLPRYIRWQLYTKPRKDTHEM
jgi:hypothetical protein